MNIAFGTASGTAADSTFPTDHVPPDTVDLATLLSTTVRVEPELMRAVRVALLPQLDVGAESDLWFSRCVASRNPRAMVLLPEVQRELRPRLPDVLARCASPSGIDPVDHLRKLLTGRHHLSPLMRLEEEVLWLLTLGGGDALWEAEAALRSALCALVEQEGRQAIADWIVSVCPRLPEPLRHTVTGWQFRSITRFLEPETTVDRSAPAGLTCRDAALVVDAVARSGDAEVPEAYIPVRLDDGVLNVGGTAHDEPGTLLIGAPATEPVVLELLAGTDGQRGQPLQFHLEERVTITDCSPATRLVTAGGDVYGLADPSRSQPGRQAASTTGPRSVLLSPWPVEEEFSQWVYDRLREVLLGVGYDLWNLGTFWPTTADTGDAPWPLRADIAVFLLDREMITTPEVRDQIETLAFWAARTGAPKPVLVPLRGVRSSDREARTITGVNSCQWLPDVNLREWAKDQPWSSGHAKEVADVVVDHVSRATAGPAPTSGGTRSFPTRYQLLDRLVHRYLQRYTISGDRDALDQAVSLFQPDVDVLRFTDAGVAAALVGQARAWRYRARLTGSVEDADRAVRLLCQVVDRIPARSASGTKISAQVRAGVLNELFRVLRVRIEIAGADPLPDTVVAEVHKAVALGRAVLAAVLDKSQPGTDTAELTACLAPLAASDAWLRSNPGQTEWAARLNFDAAGTGPADASTGQVAAARNAARLAIEAGSMSLALRAFERWFELLEEVDWTRLGETRFAVTAEGFAGSPENAAACAVALGEPPMRAVRLLERGLALQRAVLAGLALHGGDIGSCQPRWRRQHRLRREVSRLPARWTPDEQRAVTGEGPVVVLNAAAVRGDALILDDDTVTAVPLPGLTVTAARQWSPGDPAIREALRPAVRELERRLPNTDTSGPPQVTWCPTGPLSRLPVHEACSRNPAASVPVSSYAASLSDLFRLRRTDLGPVPRSRPRPLVVVSHAGGDTGWAERAEAEARAVKSAGVEVDVLAGAQATRLAVLEAAATVEVVHLICRLVPLPGSEPDSGWSIALADGPLTAADIAAADLSGTGLVFLSGYGESVGSGTEPDRDTLAGSLHLAGCRHVVTSLSPPGTPDASQRADALVAGFYGLLLGGGRRLQTDRVPFALHRIMTEARGESGKRESGSPPFLVHIGS